MSPTGRASPSRRDLGCYLKSTLKKLNCLRLHEKRASSPIGGFRYCLPEISPSRFGNFPCKCYRVGLAFLLGRSKKYNHG